MPHSRLYKTSNKAQVADYVRTEDGSAYVRVGNTIVEIVPLAEQHAAHYVRFGDADGARKFLQRVIDDPISQPISKAIFRR